MIASTIGLVHFLGRTRAEPTMVPLTTIPPLRTLRRFAPFLLELPFFGSPGFRSFADMGTVSLEFQMGDANRLDRMESRRAAD
jgi:hypothetical protein